MNDSLPVSLVMSSLDYEKWVHDDDSFVRVFVHDNGVVSYMMTTYDDLWNECQYCLIDDVKMTLLGLEGESYDYYKKELFSDYIMRTDAYSYKDYTNSDSFTPYIWVNQIGFQYFYVIIFGDYRDHDLMDKAV